jgi:hypothetical protein
MNKPMTDSAIQYSQPGISLSDVASLLDALSGYAWPITTVIISFLMRKKLGELIQIGLNRLEKASDIEIGSIKIKGAVISPTGEVIRNETGDLERLAAVNTDLTERDELHKHNRMLFLAHTIRPANPPKHVDGLRVMAYRYMKPAKRL